VRGCSLQCVIVRCNSQMLGRHAKEGEVGKLLQLLVLLMGNPPKFQCNTNLTVSIRSQRRLVQCFTCHPQLSSEGGRLCSVVNNGVEEYVQISVSKYIYTYTHTHTYTYVYTYTYTHTPPYINPQFHT